MSTRTTDAPAGPLARAERALHRDRVPAPATRANIARNARVTRDRRARWEPARDVLWQLLESHLGSGARVAVLGAGNADDLPLARIAERGCTVALIDLDLPAFRAARRRQIRASSPRLRCPALPTTSSSATSSTASCSTPPCSTSPCPATAGAPRRPDTPRRWSAGQSPGHGALALPFAPEVDYLACATLAGAP